LGFGLNQNFEDCDIFDKIKWIKTPNKFLMKKILYNLFVFIILLQLNACNQKQFGHLSKVRVKQAPAEKQAKINDKPAPSEMLLTSDSLPELVSAQVGAPEIILGSNRNLIGSKPNKNAEAKETQVKKSKLKKKASAADPAPFKPNIPAYLGLGLSALSAFTIFMDITILDEGYLALIGLLLAIPILILGIVGFSNYRRERASDGYAASLIAIIFSSLLILLAIVIFIVILLFLLTGGYY
jgi:hypothetical protein